MSVQEYAWQITDLLEGSGSVFIRTEPEVPDFTVRAPFRVIISGISGLRQKVELEVSPDNIRAIVGIFDATIFNEEVVDRIYVWNLKSLSSYFHYFVARFVTPTNSVIDLKIIENFLGIKKNRPENLVEAINRTKIAVRTKNWQKLYKSLHLPLSLRVLPTIETTPLLNDSTRKSEHPYYEIEGQVFGRMNCMKKFANSYLPHNMGPESRKVLKPQGYNKRFLSADYRHCEVTVLQWLTGDEKLEEILNSGEDLHRRIYEIVTGDPCDTDTKRDISKLMFLPVVYGCGPKTLARQLKVNESVGEELYKRIYTNFPTAMNRMLDIQRLASKGDPVVDYFGRCRKFEDGKYYLARNFVVQGVAATVCQEKLIALYKALDGENVRLAFSVHDGFCIICSIEKAKQAYQIVKSTLESESKLCPGLKMKVQIKFGARLDRMKELWRD
jgi:hypothetical protein